MPQQNPLDKDMEKYNWFKSYEPKDIPDMLEIPVVLTYCIGGGYGVGRFSVHVSNDYAGDKDNIVVAKTTTVVIIDKSTDIRQTALDSLNNTLKEIQAKAWKETEEVKARIEQLTLIEYKPSIDATINVYDDSQVGTSEDAAADQRRQDDPSLDNDPLF